MTIDRVTHPLQFLLDGMFAQRQRERAKTQMTLGKLITALESIPGDTPVENLRDAHSYRGYYDDLAFKRGGGTRPASELLAECREAMGNAFGGYRGGEYWMHANTPVWVAEYGSLGKRLMALIPFVVAEEP